MLYEDFLSSFNGSVENNDLISANNALMRELGNILVRKKQDFVDLLNESGISASINDSDLYLVNLFVNNIASNRKLMLGASLLTQMHNKQMGFDGEQEISDEGVKNGYNVMRSYFVGEEYSNETGPIGASTLGGAASGGVVGTIAGAIGDIAKATSKVSEGQQKKKYGGQEIASKREEAKQEMIKSILAQKQLKLDVAKKAEEDKAKTKRLAFIIGGSILGVAVIGLIIYSIKKKKK